MKGLTARQQAVLDIISRSMEDRGYPPTIREIGERLGIKSTNGVNDHLRALERKGYLTRDRSKSRAIRLAVDNSPIQVLESANDNIVSVPLIGRIAAGMPILAEENREATFHIDAALLGARNKARDVFVLKVSGESMIDEGILDGDLIFVERTTEVSPGEIVATLVDGDATVKRFERQGDSIRLVPANPTMDTIVISPRDGRDVSIIGRVIGVFRQV